MQLTPLDWAVGAMAGLLCGFSKTGMPGVGILVVPLMAFVWGGRASVGALLPMLIFADCFAVAFYRRHADWPRLFKLLPWVVVGIAVGSVMLWQMGEHSSAKDPMNKIIGLLVLLMLGVHLMRNRLGEGFSFHTPVGVGATGLFAGFSTAVSNAAGPIMAIFFTSAGLDKNTFMGTSAWYFLLLNLLKLPIYYAIGVATPGAPLITMESLHFDLWMVPAILAGVVTGRTVLKHIGQSSFDVVVLALAAVSSLYLIVK